MQVMSYPRRSGKSIAFSRWAAGQTHYRIKEIDLPVVGKVFMGEYKKGLFGKWTTVSGYGAKSFEDAMKEVKSHARTVVAVSRASVIKIDSLDLGEET